jgi:predicted Zn finger-like uncharacterized protein
MLINCNSCQKKFEVPDSAITNSGRLLQCGSCGNKWTQFPVKQELIKNITKTTPIQTKKSPKVKKIKNLTKKKREINLYSKEYLQKKHGLVIEDTSDNKKIKIHKKNQNRSNFFNYLLFISVFMIAIFGTLNITKKFIIDNYPFTETYINSLYEIFGILKATILSFVN